MLQNRHINSLTFLGGLFLSLMLSFSANAQQASNESKSIVVYDPLPWNHELKLTATQREKIKKINLKFYQSIYQVVQESSDHSTMQSKANQYLLQRSLEIWAAFNPTQRRKWKRLWDHYST